MNKRTTTVYQVDHDYALGGDCLLPTAADARDVATEAACEHDCDVKVSRVEIYSQPSKRQICDIYNRNGYCVSQEEMYILTPQSPWCVIYRKRQEMGVLSDRSGPDSRYQGQGESR